MKDFIYVFSVVTEGLLGPFLFYAKTLTKTIFLGRERKTLSNTGCLLPSCVEPFAHVELKFFNCWGNRGWRLDRYQLSVRRST